MGDPKVSVIVPIYKVEKYLRKCLDSIVGQTYKNLEIILVDDGSPDNCGIICDEYAAKDSRIKVIHKPNGGLSSARNAGLRVMTGDWVAFVDSDDWVEPDYIGYLLENALKNDADIAICGGFIEYSAGADQYGPGDRILDRETALELLILDTELHNAVWDKLWKTELFRGVEFPEGRTFEDIATVWKLFVKAERILCLPEPEYHYLIRQGSILSDASFKNSLNFYNAARERCDELGKQYPQFRGILEEYCVRAAIGVWEGYYDNPQAERKRLRPEIHAIAQFAREHPPGKRLLSCLGPTGRIVTRLVKYDTWWSFAACALIGRIYKLKHGRRR